MALWGLKLLDEGVDTHFLEDAMTNSDPGFHCLWKMRRHKYLIFIANLRIRLLSVLKIRWCYRNDSTD